MIETISGQVVTIDGDIPVTLRRNARARRMTLRVAGRDGAVTLTLPPRVRVADAVAFAQSRADWLRRAVSVAPSVNRVVPGATIPVEGRLLAITPAAIRAPRIEGDVLLVPQLRQGRSVAAFLQHLARDRLAEASDRYARALGRSFRAITLRDTRSRWGSCTHDGRLMYSWRLAMAPPLVLDYVAAHEIAHLAHMDHSPAFWAAVAGLMPDYARHRAWLRANGATLQAWSFVDDQGPLDGHQACDHN
ncbi:MAG: M48 family peptidase [Paracoccus denitrificans]|nr:MAG: M48 family peptidase [Paracoccus denitrificans]PZO84640.1 MAG: M48 family peptidase [Paracoccus denitrificans]